MLGGLLMRNRSLSGPGKFARLWASGLGTNSASSPSVPDSCRACSRKTARRLVPDGGATDGSVGTGAGALAGGSRVDAGARSRRTGVVAGVGGVDRGEAGGSIHVSCKASPVSPAGGGRVIFRVITQKNARCRSEEHTSELQSLMRNSYAGFSLK